MILRDDCFEAAFTFVMAEFNSSQVERDRSLALCYFQHFVPLREQEFCILIHKLLDQPGTSDAIHFYVFSCDPLHGKPSLLRSFSPERFVCSSTHFLPLHVLQKRVDVFSRSRAVVHVISVLVHVQDEQWSAHWSIVHVIPRPVVVSFAGMGIVCEYRPA